MGTPGFAVEPLKRLNEAGFNIVTAITMPDKPAGRGHKIQYSPVKEYALSNNIPLLQPERLKDEAFLDQLRALEADLQIVVAFRMLPEVVWNMPPMGTFNLHASLLPQYRGAAPINRAIMNGDTESGITTFFLTHEIDTGRVIQQQRTPIALDDNAGTLHDRLMYMGADMVVETVEAILAQTIAPIDQALLAKQEGELRPAPKIFKEDCRIPWHLTAKQVYDHVRGLSPYPAAWTELHAPDGSVVAMKVYETELIDEPCALPVGILRTNQKSVIDVACADGYLRLKSIQLAGKKRLDTPQLLCGYTLTNEYTCK